MAYDDLGELQKSIDAYMASLEIKREYGDTRSLANTLGNLGIKYKNLGMLNKAEGYLREQLEISETIDDHRGMSNALGNLGNVFRLKG